MEINRKKAADEYDTLLEEDDTLGEETLFEDVDPEDFDIYPPAVMSGIRETEEELNEYTDLSPELSGGDLDAYWQGANFDGSETSGGSSPTPDQSIVEDLGEPWGLNYSPVEEMDLEGKIEKMEKDRIDNEGL